MTFDEAFYEINGRKPTPEEAKHALAIARIVKEADLDPILLVFLADTKAQEARRRGLDELRRTVKETVERFQAVLPNIAEAHKSIGALQAVQTAMCEAGALGRDLLRLAAIIGGGIAAVWACSLYFTWQTAYVRGRDDVRAATHQILCDDLNAYVAEMSANWRKRGRPEFAEEIGQSYARSCR